MKEQIEKITEVGKSMPADVAETKRIVPVNQDYFEALMQQGVKPEKAPANSQLAIEEIKKPSLMDEVRNANSKVEPVTKLTPGELIAQSEEAFDRIGKVKEIMAAPDIKIKGSYQGLLKNKLSHIDENLRITLSKAGADYSSEQKVETQGLMNPIERYLGYLTHSQDQLKNLSSQIQAMEDNHKELTPANMLALQIKVGYIQQELEFFTSLLNKSLESTKTLMNVQV